MKKKNASGNGAVSPMAIIRRLAAVHINEGWVINA